MSLITMQLNEPTWDLTVDAFGNWASVSGAPQMAQDVASACQTWSGELLYDTTQGVPFQQILGYAFNFAALQQKFVNAAQTVPNLVTALCNLSRNGRTLGGTVFATDIDQNSVQVSLG